MVMRDEMDLAKNVVTAEAAAWLARLQGPGRTPAAEAAFKEWLEADPAHAHAFGAATDVWDVLPGAAKLDTPAPRVQRARAPRVWWRFAAASVAVVIAVAGVLSLDRGPPSYTTAVGESRTIPLQDGSHVTLNTGTTMMVDFTATTRLVRMQRGEAMFEVTKDAARPFVVEAGGKRVTALGTTFIVRLDEDKVAVTLIEGKVEVVQAVASDGARIATLSKGERVIAPQGKISTAAAVIDHPRIEAVTAWRRGEVMFDDVPLAEAVTEFNRYGEVHVRLADNALGDYRVSGVFSTRNPAEFADAIAQLHGFGVRRSGDAIEIGRR